MKSTILCALPCLAAFLALPAGVPAQKRVPPAAPKKPATAPKPAALPLDPELQAILKTAPKASDWPDNAYARLLDIGDVTVRPDGTVVATYREAFKLFNENARSKAEVTLPYNSSYQSIKVIQARTIRPDGRIVTVRPEDIRESSPYSEYLMYDDAMSVSFSMPAIEDNCIVDYTYQMVTRPMLMPGKFWTNWNFTGIEPVSLCRYTLRAPADKPLRYKLYNDEAFQPRVTTSTDSKTKTYLWEKRDIKPLPLEPSMPPYQELGVWMEVSSIDGWQDIGKWYWNLAQPQAKPDEAIRKAVVSLTADKKTDEEKVRALYDFVANRVRYVGLEFGISAYKPHAATEVHSKLYGDCKDKATLLVTMLGLAGIKAHPVLLRAGDPRLIEPGLPSLNAFNHCIALAEVNGKEVWLDATAETCAVGDIPDADRGAQAFVVRNGVGQFVMVPHFQPEENGEDITTRIALQANGDATVVSDVRMRGGDGQSMRALVRSMAPAKRKELMQRLAQSFSNTSDLKEYTLPDGLSKEGPFGLKMDLKAPGFAKQTGSLLLLPLTGPMSGGRKVNPFLSEQRAWPIVETENGVVRSETIFTLPEDHTVLDVPADLDLACPIQSYRRQIERSADGKTITIRETQTRRQGRVPAAEYPKVKAFFDAYIKSLNDNIVLKKA